MRILEWMRDVKSGRDEGQSIQRVDVSAEKHVKKVDPLFCWTATDRPLKIHPDKLDPASSTGMSINIFVRGLGVGLTHTENLMMKKLKEVSETIELELDEEEAEPTIWRNFKTMFEIRNDYSEIILITESDFILSDRTSAICITADMSFKSRLEADFMNQYQNVEFLFRQRPVALTVERGIMEVSMPVYDPNRGKLSPRELYAIQHVVFAETEIMVQLHKNYYLSRVHGCPKLGIRESQVRYIGARSIFKF